MLFCFHLSLIGANMQDIKEIISLHHKWLMGASGGKQADLSGADLSKANLSWANLSWANLSGADLSGANLSKANLSWANLSGADLSWANLSKANLSWANLSGAALSWANLSGANLSKANLSWANLSGADLSRADLSKANLSKANLSGADLSKADLSKANLSKANLSGADLSWADLSGAIYSYQQIVPQEGSFVGFKKISCGVIKLLIPAESKRSSSTGRKCRAEFVQVLDMYGKSVGKSNHDGETTYTQGVIVRCDTFNPNWWEECTGGIHFFLSKEEAEAY